jgi:hypothetical protein
VLPGFFGQHFHTLAMFLAGFTAVTFDHGASLPWAVLGTIFSNCSRLREYGGFIMKGWNKTLDNAIATGKAKTNGITGRTIQRELALVNIGFVTPMFRTLI